jgi:hypothetical protein
VEIDTRIYRHNRKHPNNRATVGEKLCRRKDGAWRPRAIPGNIPAKTGHQRTPDSTEHDLEGRMWPTRAAQGGNLHVSCKSKEVRHGRGWRQLDRKKTRKPVEGSVSYRNRQQAVDLTRNTGDTRGKSSQKTPLSELFYHKTNKEKQRNKTKEKLHSPRELGGDQLHWKQSQGEQNSPGSTRRGNKTSIARRARRKKQGRSSFTEKTKASPPSSHVSKDMR